MKVLNQQFNYLNKISIKVNIMTDEGNSRKEI